MAKFKKVFKFIFFLILCALKFEMALGQIDNKNNLFTVYFFEVKDKDGSSLSFDKGGRFYHVAFGLNSKFYEAHPYWGVRKISKIEQAGDPAVFLELSANAELIQESINRELGKKFSLYSDWSDETTTQCSKVVAKILNIEAPVRSDGKKAFSPDSLFANLKEKALREINICSKLF